MDQTESHSKHSSILRYLSLSPIHIHKRIRTQRLKQYTHIRKILTAFKAVLWFLTISKYTNGEICTPFHSLLRLMHVRTPLKWLPFLANVVLYVHIDVFLWRIYIYRCNFMCFSFSLMDKTINHFNNLLKMWMLGAWSQSFKPPSSISGGH